MALDYSFLLQSIRRHVSLSPEEEELITALFEPRSYRRRQYFLQEGDLARYTAFVLSGCLRAYAIDTSGVEHVLNFSPSGWWITDIQSCITGRPSGLNIEALEPTEALVISNTDRERLLNEVPSVERFFRILSERSLAAHQQRLLGTLTQTAEERYLTFCANYPSLVELLPQKQIASYIGVTPEFFSRMRSGMLRRK